MCGRPAIAFWKSFGRQHKCRPNPAQNRRAKSRRTLATRVLLRYGGIAIAVGVVLSGCIYASESFERFLIRDPRFFLPGPADYGLESPNLELHGVKYASRQQILRLFEPDYGRSLYPVSARHAAPDAARRPMGARGFHREDLAESSDRADRRAQARGLHQAARREHGAMGAHRRRRRYSGPSRQSIVPASRSGRSDGRREPGKARHSRAAHAEVDEGAGAARRQCLRSRCNRSGRLENHRTGRWRTPCR